MEEISFAETDSEEKEAFDTFMGDNLDTTSTDIVAFATNACDLIVNKIFHEVEQVRRIQSSRSSLGREMID